MNYGFQLIKALTGPKYDGKYLHKLVKEKLGDRRLHQTLTNVVIPTLSLSSQLSSPAIYENPSIDALLSDICIATSAAPTYLPAHQFETSTPGGHFRVFNLIDGGVAANNPALAAINEVSKQIHQGNANFFPIKATDYGRFLVMSLGIGSAKTEEAYNANEAAKWGMLGWLQSHNSTPLVDIFTQATWLISTVFEALHSAKHYLRIKDDTLSGDLSSVDIATKQNLNGLVEVGENLLKKQVSSVNFEAGICEPCHKGTNQDALIRLAGLLSRERRTPEARSP